jgi:hypothetical protein
MSFKLYTPCHGDSGSPDNKSMVELPPKRELETTAENRRSWPSAGTLREILRYAACSENKQTEDGLDIWR